MNHAKLEASRYTVFLIPVCTGGLRAPDRGSGAVRLRRKVADTASRSWGAPQRQGASDVWIWFCGPHSLFHTTDLWFFHPRDHSWTS